MYAMHDHCAIKPPMYVLCSLEALCVAVTITDLYKLSLLLTYQKARFRLIIETIVVNRLSDTDYRSILGIKFHHC